MSPSLNVIVATINQQTYELHKEMNISTDGIICNQVKTEKDFIYTLSENNNLIKYLNYNKTGVGLNRNLGIIFSSSDILLFSDDDVYLVNNYKDLIVSSYVDNPDADIIIFNIEDPNGNRYKIKKKHRIRWYNFMRYGTVRITAKKSSIIKKNIYFNENFGGGTGISSGEDSIFLKKSLDNKLKIIAVPVTILEIKNNRESTWFKGFNEKYYIDKGKLFKEMFGWKAIFIAIYFSMKKNKEMSFIRRLLLILKGVRLHGK